MRASLELPPDIDGRPVFHEVADYWHAVRGDRLVPLRSDVKLHALGLASLEALIYEWVSADRILVRFAGQDIVDRGGRELVGANFTDHVRPELVAPMRDTLDQALRWPFAFALNFSGPDPMFARFASLNLPLSDETGSVRYLLTIADVDGWETGGRPRMEVVRLATGCKSRPIDIGAGVPAIGRAAKGGAA